jgi:hypothetical protein
LKSIFAFSAAHAISHRPILIHLKTDRYIYKLPNNGPLSPLPPTHPQEERLLKKFCITTFKLTALAIIITASFLALVAQYGDNQWDPIQAIQQLKISTAGMTPSTWSISQRQPNLHQMNWPDSKRMSYGPLDKAKSMLWDGAILGQVNDSYSGIGAMAADCLSIRRSA